VVGHSNTVYVVGRMCEQVVWVDRMEGVLVVLLLPVSWHVLTR